jgi:PhoPQ-activated pathogenicity-related protein
MKPLLTHIRYFTSLAGVIIPLLLALSCESEPAVVTPESALEAYMRTDDGAYQWELTGTVEYEDCTAYSLLLTSQQWREYTWKHTLTILVPHENQHDGALLFINGGLNENENPVAGSGDEFFNVIFSFLAVKNKAIVAVLWQIPNQPLFNDLTEDALISYTLNNFREDGDYTWPLLFPMVKSVSRAMDAVQEFSSEQLNHPIKSFIVSGASKRGWTTWLTASQDERVSAIAPVSIDILNMPVNLDYQLKVWGNYSIQIQDYVNLGIPQSAHSETGRALTTMIDPYSYRKSLTMPKMIFIGTNDEYWPVDAIKHYLDDIPGENFIHYVPNAGHDLGYKQQALSALSAFFGRSLTGGPYPICKWSVTPSENGVKLEVKASAGELLKTVLWMADSEDRDFRDATFVSSDLNGNSGGEIQLIVDLPESGFRAFYVDLVYSDPNGGEYSTSTRMFVADTEQVLED